MKNFIAKLKGMNYKQAMIDHGEKLFLGVIGLFVLICLAGTSWSRYDKEPDAFTKKVEQGESALRSSAWTAERAAEFKSGRDIMQAVQMLHSPLEVGRFEYSTKFYWPMYPATLKISEPKWLAPMQPIVDVGKAVIVEVPPEQTQLIAGQIEEPESTATAAKSTAAGDEDEFVRRKWTTDVASRGAGGIAGSAIPGGAIPGGGGAGRGAMPGAAMPAAGMRAPGGAGTGSPGLFGGQSSAGINARGLRFVAVRAVFPLGDQLDELAKAMQETKPRASELVEFLDFEIQRQVAKPGDQPWSDDNWEPVDLQATLDMLERMEFDTELVDLAYTDAVFTMPLPQRVVGRWTKYASHPLIKALTEEQAEIQAQLAQKMLEEAEELKKLEKGNRRGFSRVQHDGRALRSSFSSNQMTNMLNSVQQDFESGAAQPFNPMFGGGSGGGMPGMSNMMGNFQEQLTRTGNGRMSKYLLFRYFDFQVTPGNAYRYRIRLTLRNPNFRRPVEELVDESIAAGEVRVTPWSEPTPVAFVPEEERIFLVKADKPKIETGGLPSATLDIYQWFSEAGTTIAAKLEKLQLGQFIGGHPKTEVFRPAADTLREEEITVFTGNLLTDAAAAPGAGDFDPTEHADLKIDSKKLKQLGVVDKALVVDRFGQMTTLDSNPSTDERAAAQRIVEVERRDIRARLKENPQLMANRGPGDDLDRLVSSGNSEDMMSEMQNGGMGMGLGMPGMGSPLKKNQGKAATGSKKSKKGGNVRGSGGSSGVFEQ